LLSLGIETNNSSFHHRHVFLSPGEIPFTQPPNLPIETAVDYNNRKKAMSKLIPAAERIVRARAFIQKARDLPLPAEGGRSNFSYIAQVKDLLQQARDMVKFIPYTPTATTEMKNEVKAIFEEADQANQEILHTKQ
jgi:hypothetical protein